jgi:hypothetical protein
MRYNTSSGDNRFPTLRDNLSTGHHHDGCIDRRRLIFQKSGTFLLFV